MSCSLVLVVLKHTEGKRSRSWFTRWILNVRVDKAGAELVKGMMVNEAEKDM